MFKREQITSFSEIRLKVSGMRFTRFYAAATTRKYRSIG